MWMSSGSPPPPCCHPPVVLAHGDVKHVDLAAGRYGQQIQLLCEARASAHTVRQAAARLRLLLELGCGAQPGQLLALVGAAG